MPNQERRGVFDAAPLVIATNPDKPVVSATEVRPGVLKVRRGEKPAQPVAPEATLEEARAAVAQIKEIGRKQGGTSQGSPGAGAQKGGYDYRGR